MEWFRIVWLCFAVILTKLSAGTQPIAELSSQTFCQTTICEALAERLGWDFLVIDTAAFLADGLTNVASRIR